MCCYREGAVNRQNDQVYKLCLKKCARASYLEIIESHNTKFLVCGNQETHSKPSDNPKSRLVNNSGHVAVFQVAKCFLDVFIGNLLNHKC